MKAKNFLFTAVLTFGAILFATNVSAQTAKVLSNGTTEGETGNVKLVLKLQDFQELKVDAAKSKVEFIYDSRDDYSQSEAAVAKAAEQLTAFSTKKFNINVKATDLKSVSGSVTLPTEVLGMFTVTATNKNVGTPNAPVALGKTDKAIFSNSQTKTKSADGYKIDIDYSLVSPKAILSTIGDLATETTYGIDDVYTSTVTYTIIPG